MNDDPDDMFATTCVDCGGAIGDDWPYAPDIHGNYLHEGCGDPDEVDEDARTEHGLAGKVHGFDHEPTVGELGLCGGPSQALSMGERGLCNGVESCQHGIAWNNGCRTCAAPPDDLPATLATVEDVRQVCIAAGLPDGDLLWFDETCHVTADVGYEWPGSTEALEAVYVERADDTDVSRVHAGAPAVLLWHSIQAARSPS